MNTFKLYYETEQKQDLTTQILLSYSEKLSTNLLNLEDSCDVIRVLCDFKTNDEVKVGIENAVQKVLAEAKKSLEDVVNGFVASVFDPEINGLDGKALRLIGEVGEVEKETKEIVSAKNVEESTINKQGQQSDEVKVPETESVNQADKVKQNEVDEEKEALQAQIEELKRKEAEAREQANREREQRQKAEDDAKREREEADREREQRQKAENNARYERDMRIKAEDDVRKMDQYNDIDDAPNLGDTTSMRSVNGSNNRGHNENNLGSFSDRGAILEQVQNRYSNDDGIDDNEVNSLMSRMSSSSVGLMR